MKILRGGLWLVAISLMVAGAGLCYQGQMAEAMANNIGVDLEAWGLGLLIPGVISFAVNFVWGCVRWMQQQAERQTSVMGTIGRVLGGTLVRLAGFGVVIFICALTVKPLVTNAVRDGALARQEAEASRGEAGITADFAAGKMTTNEYVMNLMNLAYDTEVLPEKYRPQGAILQPNILQVVEENLDVLSVETIQTAIGTAMDFGIEFGTDASENVGNRLSEIEKLFGTKTAAAYTKKATVLNKAKLSSQGRFVVFYTDTGDDSISEEKARSMGEMMEEIVDSYQANLGLTYSYTKADNGSFKIEKMKVVLRVNGIDENVLETAMPVYAADPFKGETNVAAFYVASGFDSLLENLVAKAIALKNTEIKFMLSVPSYPFVVMRPQNLDEASFELITAHELGHHYESLWCQKNGQECASNNFVRETLATWLAMRAMTEQPSGYNDNAFLKHHYKYLDNTEMKIDEIVDGYLGYPTFGFLENYVENVTNGQEKVMNAVMAEEALKYLYVQATEVEFQKVMTELAAKNVTNDYQMESLRAERLPKGWTIDCIDFCREEETVAPTAMKYYYFPTVQYADETITVQADEQGMIVLMGQTWAGDWEVIAENDKSIHYTIEELLKNNLKYINIAIALVNDGIDTEANFTIDLSVAGVETDEIDYSNGCHKLDFGEILDSTKGFINVLAILDSENAGEYTNVLGQAEEVKEELSVFETRVCMMTLGAGTNLDEVNEKLRKNFLLSQVVRYEKEDGYRVLMIAGWQPLLDEARVYYFEQDETETLLTMVKMRL